MHTAGIAGGLIAAAEKGFPSKKKAHPKDK